MSESLLHRQPAEVIYHFDIERGSIPLAQFVDTARATQDIIDDFNRSLFDNKIRYELRVKTPEDGSLLEVLAIIVTVGGSVLAFLGTDIGKAFFKGLTFEEPAAWAEKIGASIRQRLRMPVLRPAESAVTAAPSVELATLTGEEIGHDAESEAIALILLQFLRLDVEKLRAIGITPEKFRAAFQARNRVFKGCIDNPEVKGITFDRFPIFELKRSDFPRQITQLPDVPPDQPPKPNDLNFETIDIVVNSPNWKRDGRNWQAATGKYQEVSFSIEDEAFWLRVERRDTDLKPTIRDNMRVQWAYPAGASRPAYVKVYRVLSYNGRQLSQPMSDQEIRALQATVHHVEPDALDLFDERPTSRDRQSREDSRGND
ncbi:MAG: hypothetical protein KBA31_13050 [Alphaproteobacteria bacterium]|nr:hypothetical protein [Alphaproteobacteria bacterium]